MKSPDDTKKGYDRKIAASKIFDDSDYKKLDLYLKSAILEQLMIMNENIHTIGYRLKSV